MNMPSPITTAATDDLELRLARGDVMALTKARLSALVVVTTFAGYWLGAHHGIDWWLLFHTLFGTTLCALGSGVFNQMMEIDIDGRMSRTADRPLPARRVPPAAAFAFGIVLCGWGLVHLSHKVNIEAAAFAAATLICYIFIYTPMKQRSSLNTLVGAVAGALPPVIGWAAALGPQLTPTGFRWEWLLRAEAWHLFGLLFFWQLPHFLAINWMYREEYRRAGFVMWSNEDDDGSTTSLLSLIFTLCMLPVMIMPWWFDFGSWLAAVGGVAVTLALLWQVWIFRRERTHAAARRLFFGTLFHLPISLGCVLLFAKR